MGRVSPLSLGLCSQVARNPLLPLPVGGGETEYWASVPVFGPHPGASRPWPHPLFSAGTEEGWQGSSCTSQAGQGARGLEQGWAPGQLGRLSSWGNPEAVGMGQGEGTEATGQRRGRAGIPWVGTPAKTFKSTGLSSQNSNPSSPASWLYGLVPATVSLSLFHILEKYQPCLPSSNLHQAEEQ